MMEEKKLLGVCLWLSDRFGLSLPNLRLLFVIATLVGFGSPILVYLILALVMPKNDYYR